MHLKKPEIIKFVIAGLFMVAAAIIASLTVGRDICYRNLSPSPFPDCKGDGDRGRVIKYQSDEFPEFFQDCDEINELLKCLDNLMRSARRI